MKSSQLRLTGRRSVRAALALSLASFSSAFAQEQIAVGFSAVQPPTQEYIQRVQQQLPPAPEYFLGPRWPGVQGSPRVVTWSFVPDGIFIPSVIGENAGVSSLFARLDLLFAAQGGRATWMLRIQQSFNRWEELTGIDFVQLHQPGVDWDDGATWGAPGSAARGDIRIAMKRIDGAGGVSSVATFPGAGDILLDRFDVWEDATDAHRFLRNTMMWSQGVACGLDVSCPMDGSKLMELVIPLGIDGPQQDDLRAMQHHYGDPLEVDDDTVDATALGALTVGSSLALGALPPPVSGSSPANTSLLSIDADGESDWFRFSVDIASVANVTIAPVGSTYDLGPNNGGACGASAPFDAAAVADLQVELLRDDGVTVVASATSNGAGAAEQIQLARLDSAGTYYIRVFEGDAPLETQGYSFSLSITACTVDSDGDGTADCLDGCPSDPLKLAPGLCGCGVSDVDDDGDGTPNCFDGCPNDPLKIAPGLCGCGVVDTDTDNDGTPDCNDLCPTDPFKVAPGVCGCFTPETDTDSDGTPDCIDGCPNDPFKIAPGICGCGVSDADNDGDGVPNCNDGCPDDPFKTAPGVCGCGVLDTDTDGDGTPDCNDNCPADPLKVDPGVCGCGSPDVDSDGDGVLDCNDGCPNDPAKVAPGVCGCGVEDIDTDGDGALDCVDGCPNDPLKTDPGVCGCGVSEVDSDADGLADCVDNCPMTPNPLQTDGDGDGRGDDCDNCPSHVNPGQDDCDNDGEGDVCEIALGNHPDCDENGVPDNCQPDCNNNGQADACDLLQGKSLDTNADTIPDECQAPCPAIQTYCTAKTNSLGCTPAMGWSGVPSMSAPSGFLITCSNVIADRSGQVFYGYAASFAPFQGGYLCVRPPFRRTPVQQSVGGPGCNGTYSFDFNVWITNGLDPMLMAGLNVFSRWWMRDPQASFTTGLSDSLTFTICP